MAKLKIALSFDHELSLGRSDDYTKDLFEPTQRILEIAKRHDAPITLFTDVLCAMRFREWDLHGFYEPYVEQLRTAISDGSDVQLHLHPHWLDSTFSGGKFVPSSSFGLGEFKDRTDVPDIDGIVRMGVEFLRETCLSADPSYRCVAFRAGGYNLEPEAAAILSALNRNGIAIDSSIAKGYYFKSGISTVDFRDMPSAANWFVAPEGPLNRGAKSGLLEVPIAARPRTPFNNVLFLVRRMTRKKRQRAAAGTSIHGGHTSIVGKLQRMFPSSAWMLSFDNFADDPAHLLKILRHHVESHKDANDVWCASVSHPKSMGQHSFKLMTEFIEQARREYQNVEFVTFRHLADRLQDGSTPSC